MSFRIPRNLSHMKWNQSANDTWNWFERFLLDILENLGKGMWYTATQPHYSLNKLLFKSFLFIQTSIIGIVTCLANWMTSPVAWCLQSRAASRHRCASAQERVAARSTWGSPGRPSCGCTASPRAMAPSARRSPPLSLEWAPMHEIYLYITFNIKCFKGQA